MAHELVCWRCGHSLASLSLPLSRMDECPGCAMSLHVCRMCEHYDRHAAEQCRHEEAEYVKEKERPNFCDWFAPSASAYQPGDDAECESRRQLDALFGEGSGETTADPDSELEALFRKDS